MSNHNLQWVGLARHPRRRKAQNPDTSVTCVQFVSSVTGCTVNSRYSISIRWRARRKSAQALIEDQRTHHRSQYSWIHRLYLRFLGGGREGQSLAQFGEKLPFYTVGHKSGGPRDEKMVWCPVSIRCGIRLRAEYECDLIRYCSRSDRRAPSECSGHRAKYADWRDPHQYYERGGSVCISQPAAGNVPCDGGIVGLPGICAE